MWKSQDVKSLMFQHDELEISRRYIWDEYSKPTLMKFINAKQHQKVLDVGTGTGYLIREISKELSNIGEFYGLEIDNDLVEKAIQYSTIEGLNINFINGNIYNMPFDDNEFDMVTAEFVLCNLERPLDAIAEIRRVLKNNGVFICIDPPSSQRLYYSEVVPKSIQEIEHKVNASVAEECLKKGVDKSLGIKLPTYLYKLGFRDIKAKGHLNVKIECQTNNDIPINEKIENQIRMLERQRRRLTDTVEAGVISQQQADEYMDFWMNYRKSMLADNSIALCDTSTHCSTCLLVSGTKCDN